jgi:hypothetical protein
VDQVDGMVHREENEEGRVVRLIVGGEDVLAKLIAGFKPGENMDVMIRWQTYVGVDHAQHSAKDPDPS